MLKRLFDFSASLAGLMIVFPIMVVIGLWIKLDSKGPILYRGTRVGKDGKKFHILKFRTMVANADKIGGSSTAGDDPRLTKAGKYLRKYNIDELPQLVNVLKGEMSIVGPRPEVQMYVDMFTEEEKTILTVRPGMTDWASLWDIDEGAILAGSPDPEKTYVEKVRPKKIRLQMAYVQNHSFWGDVRIILETLKAILGRETTQDPEARFKELLRKSAPKSTGS